MQREKRMAIRMISMTAIFVILGVLICFGQAFSQTKLRLGHIYPTGHQHDKDSKWIASKVEERTGGKVRIEVFPAQTLVKQKAMFDEVSAGRVDIVLTFPGFYYGKVPMASVVALPFLFQPRDYTGVLAALEGGVHDIIDKYFAENNITLLCHLGTGSMHFYYKNKPLRVLEDLKGAMLRSPSGFQSEAAKLLGIVPVEISNAEVYTAIQRGTVNGCITSWATGWSRKLYEVCRYGTKVYYNPGYMQCLMNRGILNKLPADQQKVIKDTFRERQEWSWKNLADLEDASAEKLKSKGMEIYTLPVKEFNRWAKLARPCWNSFLEKGAEAQKLIDLCLKYSPPQ